MTKKQKLAAGVGGAFGLCVLALGWFLYSAYAEGQEIVEGGGETISEGLNAAKTKYSGFFKKNPFPSTESINQVKANEAAYDDWKAKALDVVSRGDCPPPPPGLKATAFQTKIMEPQFAELRKLPGRVANKSSKNICTEKFNFGFDKYLGEAGQTPEQQELPKLWAQFVTVTNLVDLLCANGVVEIRKIERLEQTQGGNAEANQGKQRNKGGKGNSAKGAAEADAPTCYEFDLEYFVRPEAFVKVLNALSKSPRFYVIGDFKFGREGESLKERLNKASSASGDGQTGSRRSRGGWGVVPERQEKKVEADDGLVTRPDKEEPILVTMKLSVYDFGTGGSRSDAAEKEGN